MPDDREPMPGSEDYGYDLAHEAPEHGADRPAPEAGEPVQQRTVTPGDAGGDYGYDEAHDIP